MIELKIQIGERDGRIGMTLKVDAKDNTANEQFLSRIIISSVTKLIPEALVEAGLSREIVTMLDDVGVTEAHSQRFFKGE